MTHSIPKNWKEVRLKEIGIFSKGSGISKEDVVTNGKNAVRYGELYTTHHYKIKKIHSFISDATIPLTIPIRYGDILFAGSGETIDEIGKSAAYLIDAPCYASGDIIIFSPKNQNSLFLSYTLNSGDCRKQLRELGQGQSVVHIYKKNLEKIKLVIPPLSEQKRIVAILETWDRVIERLHKKIRLKKENKKILMHDLLYGKKRLPGFSEKWTLRPLSNFVDPILRPVPKPSDTFTAIGIKSHCKGTFQKTNFDPKKIEMDTLFELKKDDLVVNITFAWEGAIAIAKLEDEGGLVSHRFPTYVFKKNVGSPDYFRQFIQMKRLRHLLQIISPGGAGRNRVMSKKAFIKLEILIPPYDEQKAIAKILSAADSEIELLEEKLAQFRKQKKYLLNNLITGRIRIPENMPLPKL